MDDFRHSLLFRLTFSYAVVFCLSSFLTLAICYYKISDIRLAHTDQELVGEYTEYLTILNQDGYARILTELHIEAHEEDLDAVFFRILSRSGEIIAATDLSSWEPLPVSYEAIRQLDDKNSYILEKQLLPHHPYDVRTIYGLLGPDKVIQIGISLEENEQYLMIFRNMFFLIMLFILPISGFIGWLISKNAVKGIREVSATANEIAKGSYDKRVSIDKKAWEIERLGTDFNNMLDKINSLLTDMKEMIDNIAHDLRSPLTRIRGIAEMNLVSDKSIEDYKEMASSTVEECDNLIEMVNTMLDITEIEAGISESQMEEIDLNRLILQITDFFAPVAQENDVRVHTNLPQQCRLVGDKQKFQRTVMNLIENAIKFTPAKGDIYISLSESSEKIRLTFKDTGAGIAQEDIPKIFNRFYRGDRSRTQSGLGLGLSLVKAIVESMGGRISVESRLDKGSLFTVTIPKQ